MANAMLEDEFKSSHENLTRMDNKPKLTPVRKSVDFAMEPPVKRTRPDVPWTTKQVVDAISTSITPKERTAAIQKAHDAFQHDLPHVHDEEIRLGADVALTKHLTYLAFHAQSCTQPQQAVELENLLSEMSRTCQVLEALYRASSTSVQQSFERMGRDLMQLCVGVIDNELQQREEKWKQQQQQEGNSNDDDNADTTESTTTTGTPDGDLLLRKATKVLGHFARVGQATKDLAHFPGLLGCLLRLVSTQPYQLVPWEARLSGLWIIANLACHNENMQMMACTPGMVVSLVGVASRSLHPDDGLELTIELLRSRAIASRALLNLSWAPENKVILAENAPLVDLLAELTTQRKAPAWQKSRTVQGILETTRSHAVGALRNLAAAPRRTKIALCAYRNGHLLDVLTDAALNDPDGNVKDRAFAAIHNLAVHDTAETIVNHPALVLALKDVLLSEDDDAMHDEDSPKKHASATLMVLERSITPEMRNSFENLRELLEAVQPSNAEEDTDMPEVLHTTAV